MRVHHVGAVPIAGIEVALDRHGPGVRGEVSLRDDGGAFRHSGQACFLQLAGCEGGTDAGRADAGRDGCGR